MNFNKSVVLFSPCVDEGVKMDIRRVTGIKVVNHLGRYLGFPSHFSRNKRSDLNYLIERVQKVIAGWKGNLFSI